MLHTLVLSCCLLLGSETLAYRFSQVSVAVASAVDAHSSWGKYELNPVLGRGTFGPRQAAVKGAILGAGLAVGEAVVRRKPRTRKLLIIGNLAAAGALTAVAVRNYGIRRTQR